MELVAALAASMLRMFLAYLLSVLVALAAGIAMGRNEKVEKILYPVIDVLQSVPILGFFPIVIDIMVRALPEQYGIQLASIFLIFTSQAWNLILGVYANVKFIPSYVLEVAKIYKLSFLARLLKIYIPASVPAIAKNSIISWAGGLFFLVSSEIITMGSTNYMLEGIGTYIQLGLEAGNAEQIALGILSIVILSIGVYVFIWNPFYSIVTQTSSEENVMPMIGAPFRIFWRSSTKFWSSVSDALIIRLAAISRKEYALSRKVRNWLKISLISILLIAAVFFMQRISGKITFSMSSEKISLVLISALEGVSISLLRVAIVLGIGTISVMFLSYLLYERKKLFRKLFILSGEFLSSVPASLWWPIFVALILRGFPPVLVSLFIIFQGAIWYIFFNIALTGIGPMEKNIMEMAKIYRIKGRYKFFRIFVPMLTPYVLSGMSSAWGGAWNATIVAEYAYLGTQVISFFGIGYLISSSTVSGDTTSLAIYVLTLTFLIVVFNRTFWAWLYSYGRKKYHVVD
ncbi:MAG: ABC transporter permease subunit [Fervidicoccaceae archaeon]